ncbi:unnamed protein product [Prunus armeniaca]|uniref:Uncharacterized protein n=1 Tax=Prunus armeniaca TaxID=36596 RepID=A0A6J5VQ17_PRUAR|nr:unnamed protein product [Prunus armeniaca]CAB4320379.1 unnamed protein product [Prunus armeniaca]
MEAHTLNVDAAKTASVAQPVRTYSSKTRQTSKISASPSKAKETVSVDKPAETTNVIKSPVTQQTSKVPTPQPSTKAFETQTVSSTYASFPPIILTSMLELVDHDLVLQSPC